MKTFRALGPYAFAIGAGALLLLGYLVRNARKTSFIFAIAFWRTARMSLKNSDFSLVLAYLERFPRRLLFVAN